MTPEFYKFGDFLFSAWNDAAQGAPLHLSAGIAVKTGKNLTSLLQEFKAPYVLAVTAGKEIRIYAGAIRRLVAVAGDTQAGLVYSDYLMEKGTGYIPRPLLDYQPGSIRDDFNFGDVLLFSTSAMKEVLKKYGQLPDDPDLAFYDLRLKISLHYSIIHIPEFLYAVAARRDIPAKSRNNPPEDHFAYVAARNAQRQKQLEKIATGYLKLAGAYLPPRTKKAGKTKVSFPLQASIVIPVLNRKRTIRDALLSALAQETTFDFNIIVVDNHSTDGTTQIIQLLAEQYPTIRHHIPDRRDLSIGGCWNEAIYSACCGRYAVQLDSDDLYSSPHILQKIIDVFEEKNCAMVVGSYTIVNERLQTIPPGLIDHREWTAANGQNNALRINGLGAPRAFNTAILRKVGFPNVGYGEDYAVALRITREYAIGRIYSSLYLCRRWTDNTDAALSVEKQNRYDAYKDKLRTLEIKARQIMNEKEA
jgi:GT2 family glycosyltransferase